MALGDNYDNNNKKQRNVNTYSLVNFANPNGVDATKISFDFWGGLIKVYISPKMENSNTDYAKYDHDNSGAVYLSHVKARQLANIFKMYIDDPVAFPGSLGINTKNAVIALHKTLQGSVGPCVSIKIFNESRQLESSFAYEFKNDFHYALKDFENMEEDLNKVFDNNVEVETFYALLIKFADNINGAVAHSVLEYGKFDSSRSQSKLNAIAQKLGIEWAQKGYNNKSTTNLFNDSGKSNNSKPNKPSPGRNYTIDDI